MANRLLSLEAAFDELDWPSLAFPTALAGAFYAVAQCTESHFVAELLRDLSIACFVSVFVTVFIEYLGHRRRAVAAESGMLELVGGALVPKVALDEFVQNILSNGIVCTRWLLEMNISRVAESDRLLCAGTVTYTLTNYTSREQTVPLKHELEADKRGVDASGQQVPRFDALAWTAHVPGASDIPTPNAVDLAATRDALHPDWLEYSVHVPANGRVEATLRRVEYLPLPGQMPWYMFFTTMRPRLVIHADAATSAHADFRVVLRHPMGRELHETTSGEWEIPTAVFPGQGFAIEAELRGARQG